MKYVVVLLSVYITVLALMPCRDKDDNAVNFSYTTLSKSKACGNQANQESCSPFCACSCCSTARCLDSNPVVTISVKALVSIYPPYTIPAIQEQPIKIWQPPQIG